MSSRLKIRKERKRKILELGLSSDALTTNMVANKLDIGYSTALGLLTDLLAEGYFTRSSVGETSYRVFVPVKEKIRETLQKKGEVK